MTSLKVDTLSVDVNKDTPNSAPASGLTGWVTETELASHLRISRRHLNNLRKCGLPHILLGSSVRFDLQEVEQFVRSRRRLSAHVERQKRRAALRSD